MEIIHGFCDLCIPYTAEHNVIIKIVKDLIELGYRNVAIEQIYNGISKDKDNTKRSSDIFPTPVSFDFLDEFKGKIKIFSRLTIIYSDNSISHALTNSLNIKKFNIIAGLPISDASLQHCCQTFNGDLITFSMDKPNISLPRKYYKLAVQRRMFFEIKYSPAIVDSNDRRAIIRRAHYYHSMGKSKNIIISSGATDQFHLRGPYDIASLGLIFGLSEEQSKNAIMNNCRSLLIRAEARRFGKTVMFVRDISKENVTSSEDEEDESDEEDKIGKDEVETDEEMEEQPSKKKKMC